MPRRSWRLAALLLVLAAPLRAQSADVIRGRVTNAAGVAIVDAAVTATTASGGLRRQARTDPDGRYTITFPRGEGDYVVLVTALGFAPRRFQLKRLADEEILVGDVVLSRVAAVLESVHVVAPREKVTRAEANAPDVGGTEQAAVGGLVPGRQQGDLNALMATIPGMTPIPGADGDPAGFSVFGLSPDENATVLNGLPFAGVALPRDADVSATVVTSPYDVSRGAFSGAQVSVRTRSGSNFISRSTSLNVDRPSLQWTGPPGHQLGHPYAAASLGGAWTGPIVVDKAFYNIAYQVGKRTSDLQNLLNAGPAALQAAGIAADSVTRFRSVLSQLGIPATAGGSPANSRATDSGSLLASFDFSPASAASHAFGVVFGATWDRDETIAQLPTDVPARAGRSQTWNANAQVTHSAYVGEVVLSETALGIAASTSTGAPFTRLPSGTVRIDSRLDENTLGLASAGFGGSPLLPVDAHSAEWSIVNQSSWFSRDNRHRLKATVELHRQAQTDDRRTTRLGAFDFNSLTDLEAGRPAQFIRSLGGGPQHVAETTGALSLGDAFKVTPDLQVQYGVRVDANHYSDRPPADTQAFGILKVKNERTPELVSVSPRFGFSWAYGRMPRVEEFAGAVTVPRTIVRGGIGVFQTVPGPSTIASALQSGGNNGSLRQVRCIGDAVPIPDWAEYLADPATIPTSCADGSSGSSFASSAPQLEYFGPGFRAPRSVRGNLQWSGPVLRNLFNATLEAAYSRNQHQRSFVDRNFAAIESFQLPAEGERAVFVKPEDIVPGSGAVALSGSRVTPAFSHVVENVSDLHSSSGQLRVTVSPTRVSTGVTWNLSYVLASTRQQTRGFSSTVGNPLAVSWGRGDLDARHAFTYNVAFNLFDVVRLAWSGRTASGFPFTPMVAGDVNGDGYLNDRAFVFDPQSVVDTVTTVGLRALLEHGPSSVRKCLMAQVGRLAARNSCESGWTSTATMALTLNPLRFHLPQRASVGVVVDNPIGAADLLLHGANGLHGWGSYARPDQTLLVVQGFDPLTRQYRYGVNRNFGSSRQLGSFGRSIAVTLTLRVDLGPSRERQGLTELLNRGRKNNAPRVSAALLKATFGSGGIVNPLAEILRNGDKLHLDGAQADSIATMNVALTGKLDSLWAAFASYAAAVPVEYDQGELYARYRSARRASVDALSAMVPSITQVLREDQQRQLAPAVARFLDLRYLAAIRAGTEGNSAAGPFANPAWPSVGSSGMGQRTDIIITRP